MANYFLQNINKLRLIVTIFILTASSHALGYTSHEVITIEKNKVESIKLPQGFNEIFIVSSKIADVKMGQANTVYVYGKNVGITSLSLSNAKGEEAKFTVQVIHNLEHLHLTIRSLFPDEDIKITSSAKGIMLSGSVSSAKVAKDVVDVATHYLEAGGADILNHLTISTSTQVILKVKIAEVSRSALNSLNLNTAGNLTNLNGFTYGLFGGASPLATAGASSASGPFAYTPGSGGGLGIKFTKGKKDLSAFIDAVNTESLATILAEPTLVAMSGETASFLSGGQFPVLIPQTGASAGATSTVEFKEYGIRLSFTPTVVSPNMISMKVTPEVSTLDRSAGVEIAGASVPGLKTRKVETSVEMASGQSLTLAGLISHDVDNSINEFPGLADIPILGALFRSTNFQSHQTELVIVVTPYINNPAGPNVLQTPTQGLRHASTLEMLFERKLKSDFNNKDNTFSLKGGLLGDAGFSTG